jgi:glutamate synthase (NADPH/NADH) small chain
MENKYKPLQVPRHEMPTQPPEKRRNNFSEVPTGYTPETAKSEAMRCLQCKKPACVRGCPVGVNIPSFINKIAMSDFSGAISEIRKKNALPAVCGRVCPQEIQCEGSCILGKKGKPVAIGALERFAADYEREHKEKSDLQKAAPTGKKIAVIGSGPAGLTAAGDLVLKGHEVTVLEAFHKAGGVLVYGIPEFRLPKVIVENEIRQLEQLGVEIETNMVAGRIVSIEELFEQGYNAVFVGSGAGLPKFLNIPGENLTGICSANEYLTRANLMKAYRYPEYDTPIPKGKSVCIFGAGNVAMDAARTAVRLGSEKVSIIYRRTREEMPARIEEVHHAKEEGIEFRMLTSPLAFNGDGKGRVTSVTCQKMKLGEADSSGRPRPVPIPDSQITIPCDLAVIAVGSGANPILTEVTPSMNLNKWGYIIADENTGRTTMKRVWAGGDIVTGQATVILAMGAARKASEDIHNYLTNTTDQWS